MKKHLLRSLCVLLVLLLAAQCVPVCLSAEPDCAVVSVRTEVPAAGRALTVTGSVTGSGLFLAVPAGTDFSAFPLTLVTNAAPDTVAVRSGAVCRRLSGTELVLDLNALCGKEAPFRLTFTVTKNGRAHSVRLTVAERSATAAIYLTSADPENKGREWVEASPDKSNRASGSLLMTDGMGNTVYDGELTQIKGRGNSTWAGPKKPYQIKLGKKADLLQTGDKSNASKTWVLLANCYDPTLLHNTVTYALAGAMGMEYSMQSVPVDLYYDGEYRGLYLLCEKVSLGSGRVDIENLDDLNEEANPGTDFGTLSPASGKTANGAEYICYPGVKDPADITGGYLLEMDYEARSNEEASWFCTKRGYYVTVKCPEYASRAEMDYIATLYQSFEDAAFCGGTDPYSGKACSALCDIGSVAQYYLINEISKNTDSWNSSSYLYKSRADGRLFMGPVWDYDLTYGEGYFTSAEDARRMTGFYTLYDVRSKAVYALPEFREAVKTLYTETVWPLIRDVLLSEDAAAESGGLCALSRYEAQISASAACNFMLWDVLSPYSLSVHPGGSTYASNLAFFREALRIRGEWLYGQYAAWNAETFEPLGTFRDVDGTEWYAQAAEEAAQLRLLSGTGDNTFSARLPVTRAMAVQAVYNLCGNETSAVFSFPDVPDGAWYAGSLRYAAAAGVVCGYPDGRFGPDDCVSRQDFAVMLWRAAREPAASVSVLRGRPGAAQISGYALSAMAWAVEKGILSGNAEGDLLPLCSVSRAELAVMLVRAAG